ncbi:MAG: PP0621 family protein [Candidatus Thiodiazotropha sp. 6PLUC2]
MGLKTIFFGLAIWGIYLIVRHFARLKSDQKGANRQVKSVESVKCDHCGLHIPKNEAVEKRGVYFCSKDHLLAAESKIPPDNE